MNVSSDPFRNTKNISENIKNILEISKISGRDESSNSHLENGQFGIRISFSVRDPLPSPSYNINLLLLFGDRISVG